MGTEEKYIRPTWDEYFMVHSNKASHKPTLIQRQRLFPQKLQSVP